MLSEKEKIEAGIAKAERRQEEALLAGDRALAGDIQKQLLVLQEDLKNERKRLENERQRLENERRRQHELVAAQGKG
jgi:molecular chaperone GrpE (heat shock protein)